jgi:hypothetical protein
VDTLDALSTSILATHDDLATRLARAQAMEHVPGEPRKGYEHVDTFLAVASKHLNAVDAVILPAARRALSDGGELQHDYLRAARELELAMAHTKAREYGSVYDAGRSWSEVWSDVGGAVAAHRRAEFQLVERLASHLTDTEQEELAEELHQAERRAPSRPHPYIPHTGVPGKVARRVMYAVDSFWDAAEGRMIPEPPRRPHPRPGLLTQYILADPRFDEEDEETEQTEETEAT